MPRAEIVINVYGGVVQEVYASDSQCDVIVVDWDGPDTTPDVIEATHNRQTLRAHVVHIPVCPLEELAGSTVEAVIEAAEQEELVHANY